MKTLFTLLVGIVIGTVIGGYLMLETPATSLADFGSTLQHVAVTKAEKLYTFTDGCTLQISEDTITATCEGRRPLYLSIPEFKGN